MTGRRPRPNAEPKVGTEASPPRLVPEDEPHKPANTERSFIRIGDRRPGWSDLYHVVLLLNWPTFLLVGALVMLLVNILFALLYLLTGGLQGGGLGAFADAFYYSLQTITTVGSSVSHPVTHAANLVASAEAMVGMTAFAVLAAVSYARLSRPTARILFSRVAAVGMHDGRRALTLRCANRRYNHILEARATVTLVQNETTTEGTRVRAFHEMPLVNDRNAVFALPWTVIHPIDSNSPLHGRSPKDLAAADVEILVVLTGIDDAFAQAVHSRHSYVAADLRFDARLVDVMAKSRDGRVRIDFRRFHDVERLEKT